MRGYDAKRLVLQFGSAYGGLQPDSPAPGPLPAELEPFRERAAAWAGLDAAAIEHELVAQYPPGAAIGWHRDVAVFDQVLVISLAGEGRLRLRRRTDGGFDRFDQLLPPRSIYRLDGPARNEWEHSLPPVESVRYSISFRTRRKRRR